MTNGNGKRLKFPHKLFDMLERTTGDPLWSGVVSWSASGRAFDIKDRDGLCDILPEFFRQNKFKSFVSFLAPDARFDAPRLDLTARAFDSISFAAPFPIPHPDAAAEPVGIPSGQPLL